ncbi:MAG: endonuclease/exonuclease/phosphatase family protein, partial [Flavobacteriaceae bacterium]|nr:endonuclease/exonuclease/phosphatase family protein [Flavobacteriaceae bacterium]
MQETHSTLSCEDEWKKECDGDLLFSHGSSESKGVLIGFTKNLDITIDQTSNDKSGRILISDVTVNSIKYTLINLYNANTEQEQINTLNSLKDHLLKHKNIEERLPILMGDLNFIFDIELDALGGNPKLKNRTIASFTSIQDKLDISDIFRIRFPNAKRFTFRQKLKTHGIIHRRLDYIFISNTLQEYVNKVEVLPSILSDHSPVLVSLSESKENYRGKGLWKFNNSLLENQQ